MSELEYRLIKLLREAVAYVERDLAHSGKCLSVAELQREVERVRKHTAVVTVAHDSADVGTSFHLADARQLLEKYEGMR